MTRGSALHASLRRVIEAWAVAERVTGFTDLKERGFKRPSERQEGIGAVRVGRGESFSAAWAAMFFADKYGMVTTHWSKLLDRVRRGVGNPCPSVLIGLPSTIVDATM